MQLDPELHRRFTDAVFALQHNLSKYKLLFPEFTDHTNLHSMTVIDFCNQLIGSRIDRLNADELYALLMGCYLHDTGMGITMQDYELFSAEIDFGRYFDTHSRDDLPTIIRDFHHEFSGQFIRKYAELFEIPSEAHRWAIIQIARGHRKTDLADEREYPAALPVPGGNAICLPYLAALIRLADEIDATSARNPILLYDLESMTREYDILWYKTLRAIRTLEVTEDAFTLHVGEADGPTLAHIRHVAEKMQKTLDYCRAVVSDRTPYAITQQRVIVEQTA